MKNLGRLGWSSACFGLLFAASAASAQIDPDQITINSISHGGNGCPQGTVGTYLSDDARAFTLIFDEYLVEAGPGIPRNESRKFCNINLDLRIPNGWQYSIFQVDYEGFADLERGTFAELSSNYKFSGASGRNNQVTLRKRFRGYYSDDYIKSDDLGVESLVWSPCGINRALNIKSSARVLARGSRSALLTVDTVNGEFTQIYHLKFRRCDDGWGSDDDWFSPDPL